MSTLISAAVARFRSFLAGTGGAGEVGVLDAGGYFTSALLEQVLAEVGNPDGNLQTALRASVNFLRYMAPADWANCLNGVEGANYSAALQTAINNNRTVYVPGLVFCGATQINIPAGHALCGGGVTRLGGVATSDSNLRWRDLGATAAIVMNAGSTLCDLSLQSVGTPNAAARAIDGQASHETRNLRIRDFPSAIRFVASQFYTRHYSLEITGCTTGLWFSSTVYNLNLFGCIIRSTVKPFKSDAGMPVQMVYHGGSVESMTDVWSLRRFSQVTFDGTYFELNNAAWVAAGSPASLYVVECEQDTVVNLHNCKIFLNYIKRFISASGVTGVTLNMSGNSYHNDATGDAAVSSCVFYPPSAGQVNACGDSWTNMNPGSVATYCITNQAAVPWNVVEPTGYAARIGVGTLATDPASLAAGVAQRFTVTVLGAVIGMRARATFTATNTGIVWFAEVTSNDTITVTQLNTSGAPVDLAAGTITVYVSPTGVRS